MKLLSKLKQFSRKSIMLGAITAATLGAGLFATTIADASSGANCDNNAVVYCGATSVSNLINKYNNGDTKNSAASIHNIYDSKSFNISAADVNSMKTDAVSGTVDKNGDVFVGNTLVATNALTAGRQNISGSTKETNNGTTFYTRKPSVSFLDSSLSAMVDMKNGVFQFAVINSCGNPVVATPKKPNYTVTKLVSVKGADNFKNSITVTPGTHVEYKITVASTGAIAAKNITVNDVLPKGVTEVANTLTRDGNPGKDKDFFGNGVNIASLAPKDSVVFKFEAVVGSADKDTLPNCTVQSLNNVAMISAPGLPNEHNGAVVDTKCLPKPPAPVFACTNLDATVSSTDVNTFKFTASSNVKNGAKVTGYTFVFGDGTTKTVSSTATSVSTNHTYAAPGTFNAMVTAIFNVNGVTKTDTSNECKATVTIKKPVPPAFACTNLSATADSRTEFTFNSAASASNGAVITGYAYSFGDGNTKTVNSSATTNSVSHTYAAAGTFNATVTALFTVNGKAMSATSPACNTTVTVNKLPPKPVFACTNLDATADSRTMFTFNATASASNGAVITGYTYNFGDGTTKTNTTSATTDSASHTYTAPGTYTATVTALISVNGKATTVTSAACQTKVTVTPAPAAQCTGLTATQVDGDAFSFNASAAFTTSNGASLTASSFDWGDQTAATAGTVNGNTVVAGPHTYANAGTFTITATLSFTSASGAVKDSNCSAVVTINAPQQPVFTCDEFTVSQGDDRTVTVTSFKTTANNGAVFSSADINWGDDSSATALTDVAGQTHQYAADGTFTITATAHFTVNGQDVTASGPACTQQVTFTTPPVTPPTTPTPPTTLVNTGAGNVIGLFAAATIFGTAAYRWFIGRRLSREG